MGNVFTFCFERGKSSNTKFKYIIISLLLLMCSSSIHCSKTEKSGSDADISSIISATASDIRPSKDVKAIPVNGKADGSEISKSICPDGDANCDEKGEEISSTSGTSKSESENIQKSPEKFPRSGSEAPLNKDISESHDSQQNVNIFANFDRTIKEYLTKNDIPAFMQHKTIERAIKVSVLEANLFLNCIDTDHDGKISKAEYSYATSGHITNLISATFKRLKSEDIDCIYEEDLELLSDNIELDFLLLDRNYDDCFSFDEFELFFYRFGLNAFQSNQKTPESNNKESISISESFSGLLDDKVEQNLLYGDEDIDLAEIKEDQKFSSIEEAIDSLWESIDENEDGYLSQEELAADLEWYGFEAADKVAVPLFSLIDSDMDEKISIDELKRFFNAPPTENKLIKEWINTFWLSEESSDTQNLDLDFNPPTNQKWVFSLAFIIFDKNKNDNIDWEELKLAMELYRKYNSNSLADSVTDAIDLDKDGRISLAEFASSVSTAGNHISMEYVDEFGNTIEDEPGTSSNFTREMIQAFEKIDKNEDGFVVSEELKDFLELRLDLLSEEDLKEIFTTIDENENGLITESDISKVLTIFPKSFSGKEEIDFEAFKMLVYNSLQQSVTDKEVDSQYLALDTNADTYISALEFLKLVNLYGMTDESEFLEWIEETLRRREKPEKIDEDFIDAFSLFDQDGNGFIDKEELGNALDKLKNRQIEANEISEYFTRLDINKDHVISMTEFDILLWKKE